MKCLRAKFLLGIFAGVACLSMNAHAMKGEARANEIDSGRMAGVLLYYVESNWFSSNATKFLLVRDAGSQGSFSSFNYNDKNVESFSSIKGKQMPERVAGSFTNQVKYFNYDKVAELLDYSNRSCTINNKTDNQQTVFLLNYSGIEEKDALLGCKFNGLEGKFFSYNELKAAYDELIAPSSSSEEDYDEESDDPRKIVQQYTEMDEDKSDEDEPVIDTNLLWILFSDKKFNLQWLYDNKKLSEMPAYEK